MFDYLCCSLVLCCGAMLQDQQVDVNRWIRPGRCSLLYWPGFRPHQPPNVPAHVSVDTLPIPTIPPPSFLFPPHSTFYPPPSICPPRPDHFILFIFLKESADTIIYVHNLTFQNISQDTIKYIYSQWMKWLLYILHFIFFHMLIVLSIKIWKLSSPSMQ